MALTSVLPAFQSVFFAFFLLSGLAAVSSVIYCLRLSMITLRMVFRSRVGFALTLLHNSVSMPFMVIYALVYLYLADILPDLTLRVQRGNATV